MYTEAPRLLHPLKSKESGRTKKNLRMRHADMQEYGRKCLFKSLKLSSAYAMFTDIQADVLAQA